MRRGRAWWLTTALGLVAAWGVALFDVAVAPRIALLSGRPSLAAATTVALALHFGPWVAAGWGLAAGLFMDVLAVHPVGLLALPLGVTGFVSSYARNYLTEDSLGVPLATAVIALAACAILQWPLARILGFAAPWHLVGQVEVWASVLYSAGLSWVIFTLVRAVHPIAPSERPYL